MCADDGLHGSAEPVEVELLHRIRTRCAECHRVNRVDQRSGIGVDEVLRRCDWAVGADARELRDSEGTTAEQVEPCVEPGALAVVERERHGRYGSRADRSGM